jgi:hypothetical protein
VDEEADAGDDQHQHRVQPVEHQAGGDAHIPGGDPRCGEEAVDQRAARLGVVVQHPHAPDGQQGGAGYHTATDQRDRVLADLPAKEQRERCAKQRQQRNQELHQRGPPTTSAW